MENKFEGTVNKPEKDKIVENNNSSNEDFFNDIKEVVIKRVSEILGKNEEELTEQEKAFYDRYVAYLTISTVASMGAGNFFSEMIPNSMNKPKKEYDHKDLFPSIVEMERFIKEKRKDFQKDDSFKDITKDFKSGMYEKEDEDTTVQTVYNRFVREDGKVILEELVNNYLKKESNVSSSTLIAVNWGAGIKIDFEQMLPNGYSFSPAEMIKIEKEIDSEKLEIKIKVYPIDLKNYKGTKNSEGSFYAFPYLKQVAYGDLSKKGGLVSLFHEIAHAWQDAYHGENNKGNFTDFWKETSNWLKILKNEQDKFNEGSMTVDKYNKAIKHIAGELTKAGVEFDSENFVYQGQNLEKGSIIVTDFEGGKYVVKCDNFDNIKKGFEKEERDAWAHALLMLKFLKKRGVDLEPEMKNISDFKNYIEPCLESYQKSMEGKIEIVGGGIGFVKKSKNG